MIFRLAPKRTYAIFYGNRIIEFADDEKEIKRFYNTLRPEIRKVALIMFKNLTGDNPTPPGEWIYWRKVA